MPARKEPTSTPSGTPGTPKATAPRSTPAKSAARAPRTTKAAAAKPVTTTATAPAAEQPAVAEAAVVPQSAPETVPAVAPARLPYRLLTGPDTREFCERVSAALADGYILYGSPSVTFNGETVIAAQAVVLPYAPPAPPAPIVDPYAVPATGFAPFGGAL
ncbi:DUF1737 domain-containing protein [Arthrobacter sp. RAF14]|uniref:DUF1737 domain-containing protein n=1 Tax=Arthrobacter sp. RAF14 TaxID=3233051 RepID=UPI003F8D918F